MGELVSQLVPEMLGLVVTPGAVIACLLLLASPHPIRNVVLFAASFLGVYVVVSALVLGGSRAAGAGQTSDTTRAWVSVGVGALFLGGAVVMMVRGRSRGRPRQLPRTPGWVRQLEDPEPRTTVAAGLVLAVVNPNVVILLSGLTIVVTLGVDAGDRVVGAVLLVGACALDFLVPSLAFVLLGERARTGLADVRRWLVANNRVIGIVVLLAFGLLFLLRGLASLA